jgi:hypothetical protein
MIRNRGEQPGKRRLWPLPGLLLVAFILGHDALMALEAVAPPREAAAASHHTAHPLTEDVAPVPHGSAPEPGHPDNCRVGHAALLRSGDDVAGVDQALPPVDRVTAPSASSSGDAGAFAWEEPRWPPGTLRALIQVYRI